MMMRILAGVLLAVVLEGCSSYSDGTPIDWSAIGSSIGRAGQDLNANAPKTTYCNQVGTQVFCRTQ